MFTNVIVNKAYAIIMAFFAAVFLLSGVCLMLVGSWIGGAVCILLALVYLCVSAMYGAVVHIDAKGVSRKILFCPKESYTWEELREVGVFGSRVLKQEASNKVGTLYLYVSTQAMTDEERFNMVLRWPIRQIHFVFSPRNLELVQYFWNQKIETFNTGDLRI